MFFITFTQAHHWILIISQLHPVITSTPNFWKIHFNTVTGNEHGGIACLACMHFLFYQGMQPPPPFSKESRGILLHGLFPHHSDLLECLGKPIS
jgi:hypothetical protein